MKRLKKIVLMVVVLLAAVVLLPVNAQAATNFKLSTDRVTTYVGASLKVKVTGATGTVEWTSSNSKVAKVSSSGKITAVNTGKAIIKAKNNGKTLKCAVTVKKLLTAKQAINKFKSDGKNVQYITMNMYTDEISDSRYYGGMATDLKKNIVYIDLSVLGVAKRYITKNRVYWYSEDDSRWYYYKNSGSSTTSQVEDTFSDIKSPVSKGITKFNGKKAMKVQVVASKRKVMLYFDITDFSLIGMSESVKNGENKTESIVVFDFKSKVKIPSEVTNSATYKEENFLSSLS